MLKIQYPTPEGCKTLLRLRATTTLKEAEKLKKLIEKHTYHMLIIIDENNAE